MDPHNIHSHLFDVHHELPDPGNGGTIRFTGDLMICEMVSAAAETRTLAPPSKSGIRAAIRLKTDGGDVVVTQANGFNAAGEVKATFNDASDILILDSVETTTPGTFRWQIATRRITFLP